MAITTTTLSSALSNQKVRHNYWSDHDIGLGNPQIMKWRDRVFIGAAADGPDTSSDWTNNTSGTWISSGSNGAAYLPRESQLAVMSDIGSVALSGGTKSGESVNSFRTGLPIAVAAYVINNSSSSVGSATCWGSYIDIQHEPSFAGTQTYGLEIAAKNAGTNQTGDPFGTGFGVYGIWADAGGDNSYGPTSTFPSNCAFVVLRNTQPWNNGITFTKDGLTLDGNGYGRAINFAAGHKLTWFSTASTTAASITAVSSGFVISGQLPSTNPAVAGQWWNNAGTVSISTG